MKEIFLLLNRRKAQGSLKWTSLLGLLVTLVLCSCENDLAEISKAVDRDMVNTEVAYEVEMLYSDSAVLRVRIRGDRMIRHLEKSNPWEEFPDGVTVDIFNDSGRTQGQLTADYAVRYQDKREVVLTRNVVWKSNGAERMDTEKLIWDERNQKVYSKSFARITKPEEVIYTHGFEANEDFTHWTLNAMEGELLVEGLEDEK